MKKLRPTDSKRPAGPWESPSVFSLAALALVLVVACGGDVSAATTSTGSTSAGATTTTTVTTTEVTLTDLTGSWDNSSFRLEVNEGGEYVVREPKDLTGALMGGFIARDGDRFSFVTATTGECPGQTGTYEAELADDQLILVLVDDPCVARAAGFAEPFTLAG